MGWMANALCRDSSVHEHLKGIGQPPECEQQPPGANSLSITLHSDPLIDYEEPTFSKFWSFSFYLGVLDRALATDPLNHAENADPLRDPTKENPNKV